MKDVSSFGAGVLLVSAALALALLVTKLSGRFSIPVAAPFLVAGAFASDIFPSLARRGTRPSSGWRRVALIVILFDGGLSIGWRRFETALVPIASLGIVGTFATAAGMTLVAHWALGLGWTPAGLLGAAVAPTDPAVMFSVLADREIGGRTGTILEGESGANDPVGIALMIGLVELATHGNSSAWIVVREFALQMSVGLAVGIAGGLVLREVMHRVSLPSAGLYTVRTLAAAGVVYGVAAVAHGSGFLAVFIAGLLVGDARVPFRSEVAIVYDALSSLAEIVVFAALGLTVAISSMGPSRWAEGLLLAAALACVVRPLVDGAAPAADEPAARRACLCRLGRAERRGPDPARGLRRRGRHRRRAAPLRARLRRRPGVGARAGQTRSRSRPPARGADAPARPAGPRRLVGRSVGNAFGRRR